MAFNIYLKFDGVALPTPTTYDLSLHDVESESSGETEAGTKQRDIARTGVVTISVAFSVTSDWLKKLSNYSEETKISVSFLRPHTGKMRVTEMYITEYAVKLAHDTSFGSLWNVSFVLNEY